MQPHEKRWRHRKGQKRITTRELYIFSLAIGRGFLNAPPMYQCYPYHRYIYIYSQYIFIYTKITCITFLARSNPKQKYSFVYTSNTHTHTHPYMARTKTVLSTRYWIKLIIWFWGKQPVGVLFIEKKIYNSASEKCCV